MRKKARERRSISTQMENKVCINTEILASAIVGHLVGDYLLQNDWMALNKKKNGYKGGNACSVHCIIWTISVMTFSGWWYSQNWFWDFVSLLIPHCIQDRTQIISWWTHLKWKDQSKFAQPPMSPWSLIVVDNVWHILTIWLVWRFVA